VVEERVWEALELFKDPEIPAVSVVDMGMVASVEVGRGRARVALLPTFTGCPALPVIRADVAATIGALEGIEEVEVQTTFTPPWSTDRITPEGRRKLRAFGLAPPGEGGTVLVSEIGLPRAATCPLCGSTDTVNENLFGPTPCRALYYCRACRNPFEQFKSV
jgi:ring-1,2-phenylacetyl-CoA epoxidase subunit PaaD